MTLLMDCESLTNASNATRETSLTFSRWEEEEGKWEDFWETHCGETDDLLSQTICMVNAWRELALRLDQLNRSEASFDPWAIGDKVHPYLEVADELLQRVQARLLDDAPACGLQNHTRFIESVEEMRKVSDYLSQWPINDCGQIAAIRKEYATGKFRTFKEFADEVCGADHQQR